MKTTVVRDQYGNKMVDSTGRVWDKDALRMHMGRLYISKIQGHISEGEWDMAQQTYRKLTEQDATP